MKSTKYNKLVRDKIPSIIKDNGKTAVIRILNEDEYKAELMKKLSEEVKEYTQEPALEELADILEIIYASSQVLGSNKEELERIRKDKANKRGGFEDKIFLEEVTE